MSGEPVLASQLLPFGIQVSDLEYISMWTLVALVITAIGIVFLRLMAARSLGLMVTIVVVASVLTSMAGVGVIAYRMMATPSDRDVMLNLMAIAGLAGLAVALFVGRRLTKASRALSSAVQGVGDNGVYVPPPGPCRRNSPSSPRSSPPRTSGWPRPGPGSGPWRPAGASSSPGSATTCALRWPACGPWPRRWKTRWWSIRARYPSTTRRSAARWTG